MRAGIRAALLGALVLAGCRSAGGTALAQDAGPKAAAAQKQKVDDVTAQDYVPPALPTAKVVLGDAFGGQHVVEVEVAATEPSRTRGLMWRTELEGGKGMLFVFHSEQPHSFWMRNTLIPLDMLFIGADGTVVGIVQNAEPRTLSPRAVRGPSKYVLEVPGGWTQAQGIRPGVKAQFHGVAAIPVE